MRHRLVIMLLVFATGVSLARGEEAALGRYDTADVAPTKTSIYVGTVSLTVTPFLRKNGKYESNYRAKVFPYFFYSENGVLSIDFSDDALQRLARGETVQFTGEAASKGGDRHRVEGRAAPADGATGKLKVRVFVLGGTELIFNTTYRFPAVK